MRKKEKIILLSAVLILIITPCLVFIFFDKIVDIGLLIRSYQSKHKFTESNFDHFFSKNSQRVFDEKSEFIGYTKNNVYGCQFKMPTDSFRKSLVTAKFNHDKQNRDIFNRVNKYANDSGLALLPGYEKIIYHESGFFIKDISDSFIRGPVYIYVTTCKDDILLITICFIRI